MPSKSAKILLTGLPGCGKTTAMIQIANTLNRQDGLRQHGKVAGFYTQEIREANSRNGFRWRRLDGADGILAHIDIKSPFKVGKYRVDVAGFEKSVLATVAQKGTAFISEIKNYPGTKLFRLTHQNRDKIIAEISQTLFFEKQKPDNNNQ